MYKIRADYDFRMAWGASPNKVAKAMGMGKTGKKKG
jgi:hypothetical protein